jgi:carboxypeptidase Q
MMEAMRILKTVGARPRRTIRVARWGGEEEGHHGCRIAEVLAHVRSRSQEQADRVERGVIRLGDGKDGAGAVLPIRIRGSRNEPKFGLDFRRALKRE